MRKLVALSAAFMLLLVSCGGSESASNQTKNSPEYNMIGGAENVAAIWSVDVLELIDNSGVLELDLGPMGMVFAGTINQLTDPKESGIDFDGNTYTVVTHNPDYDFDCMYTYFKVVNRKKVDEALESTVGMMYGGHTNEQEDYDRFLTESGFVGLWDDKHLVMVQSTKDRDAEELVKVGEELLSSRYTDAPDNQRIKDFMAATNDVGCLINLETSAKMGERQSNVGVAGGLLDAYKDGFLIGAGNFSNGEMLFTADVDAENLKSSDVNFLGSESVSRDLLQTVALKQAIQVIGANCKVEQMTRLMGTIEYEDQSLLSVLMELGISENDFKKAVTGEFAVSTIGIRSSKPETMTETDDFDDFFEEESSMTSYITDAKVRPEFLIALELADRTTFDKLLESFPESSKENGLVKLKDIYVGVKDSKVLLSSNMEVVSGLVSGDFQDFAVLDFNEEEMNNPVFGYWNVDYSTYSVQSKATMEQAVGVLSSDQLWMAEKVVFFGSFDHFEFQVVMKDKSDNALKIFIHTVVDTFLADLGISF